MKHVLLVDDEPRMLDVVSTALRARDYTVSTAPNAGAALKLAASCPIDVVALDLSLPDLHGLDVIQSLRAWSSVPIIVVSGRTGISDRVQALDAGADDYLTKPFAVDELAARIRAVLRRSQYLETPGPVAFGPYAVDLAEYTITRRPGTAAEPATAHNVQLTPTEWRLLRALLRAPGRLATRRSLLVEVWGDAHRSKSHNLAAYMATLRRKLEADPAHPQHLITEPGLGYRFRR
ncbi:response regulator transcription factor [Streptomyces sp. NBC_01341]|uniref:response regulator transcription factor n=1 Tax=Streptomyces sp. NBC_01341 TaxID=2903831 RepID=UPI002E13C973|nr:response regulator transcription factor [Streptomyces sp. NBC_01341]